MHNRRLAWSEQSRRGKKNAGELATLTAHLIWAPDYKADIGCMPKKPASAALVLIPVIVNLR